MQNRPTDATDAELVLDARRGDTAAFEALTARHFPMVYALAYARLGAREAAEDLAQEVFLLATLHLDALADPERVAAWLGRIARNEAGMWRRRSQSASRLVRLVPLDDLAAEPAAPASQDARTALEADEETRALHEALFRLPEALREVVVLHYFEDLSKAEIAERLEVHPATVGRQIEKALKAMKRTLEPILRRAAPAFRHSGKAAARTTLLVGAVAAMSAPAKAALAAQTGASAALAALAQTAAIATSWQTISSGGFLMSAKTQVAAVIVLLALIAGATYYEAFRTVPAPAVHTVASTSGNAQPERAAPARDEVVPDAMAQTEIPPAQISEIEVTSVIIALTTRTTPTVEREVETYLAYDSELHILTVAPAGSATKANGKPALLGKLDDSVLATWEKDGQIQLISGPRVTIPNGNSATFDLGAFNGRPSAVLDISSHANPQTGDTVWIMKAGFGQEIGSSGETQVLRLDSPLYQVVPVKRLATLEPPSAYFLVRGQTTPFEDLPPQTSPDGSPSVGLPAGF